MATYVWQVPILEYGAACELAWQAHVASTRGDTQRLASLQDKLHRAGCPRPSDWRNDRIEVVPKGGRLVISRAQQPLPGLPR